MNPAVGAGQARRGRPLRFLGAVIVGWIGLRVVLLWPQLDSPAAVIRAIVPPVAAQPITAVRPEIAATKSQRGNPPVATNRSPDDARPARRHRAPDPIRIAPQYGDPQPAGTEAAPALPGLPRPVPAAAPPSPASRWSGSAWIVARGGSGIAPGTLGGQLGGSQAGVRFAYLLDRRHRIALAGRVTAPLGPGLREAALGIEWQPTRLPLRIVAEQRAALGGGRGGPAIGVIGGFGPVGVAAGFRLEGYGEAGAIRRASTEAYVDGGARLTRPLAKLGAVRIDLGAGTWGAAQRGAARFDVGPTLSVAMPIARQPVRLSLDWRARVAGDAHPGSGPALTLGADF